MQCHSSIDWSASAAWAQAILSGLAIFGAVKLQDRDRQKRAEERELQRVEAILAITQHCLATLKQLDDRAEKGQLTSGRFGFYEDESSSDLTAVTAIDLSSLENPQVSAELMIIRRLMTTARRRLAMDKPKVKKGEKVTRSRFRSLKQDAQKAHDRIVSIKERLPG